MSSTTNRSSPIIHTNYSSFDEIDPKIMIHPPRKSMSENEEHNNDANYVNMTDDDPLAPPDQRNDVIRDDIYLPPNRQKQRQQQGEGQSNYRGFVTSIHDMYLYNEHEGTDCCAMTCCGVLQSDRDQYLLTGNTPPSIIKRFTVHVLLPLTLFVTAGVAALRIENVAVNEITCLSILLLLLVYCCVQCQKGRTKRRNFRKDLLYTKYQIEQQQREQHQQYSPRSYGQTVHSIMDTTRSILRRNDDNNSDHFLLGQSKRDIKSAHPCCLLGCYPDDHIYNKDNDNVDSDIEYDNRQRNVCSKALNCFLNPMCCGSAITCAGGVCAIAQEAREVHRSILPSAYRRIDYITMEPFIHYYPLIYQRKVQKNYITLDSTSIEPHETTTITNGNGTNEANIDNDIPITSSNIPSNIKLYGICGIPLSRLSYRLVQTLIASVVGMFAWVYLSPYYWKYIIGRNQLLPTFALGEFFVLLATLLHAILFLSILVYITNNVVRTANTDTTVSKPVHSQLSLDALIKFFATGFFLSASLAFFWEVVAVLIVDVVVSLLLAICGVDIMAQPDISAGDGLDDNDDDDAGDDNAYSTATTTSHTGYGHNSSSSYKAVEILRAMLRQQAAPSKGSYHLTHILGTSVPSQPLLAPYFVNTATDFDDVGDPAPRGSSATPEYVEIFGYDHPFLYTIYLAVGAFCVAALIEELCKYYGFRMSQEHPDFLSQQELIDTSKVIYYASTRSALTSSSSGNHNQSMDEDDEDDEEEEDNDDRQNAGRVANNNNGNQNNVIGIPVPNNYSKQLQSMQANGAAITLAMVATAIGFSCCENLIYVFVYAGGSVALELGVLIERALFPLHPIVAAIQSIGVCQRDLERSRGYHLGYILLPAIIVHGCFDFFILWIDFLGKLNNSNTNGQQDDQQDGDLEVNSVAEILSVLSCVVVMVGGIVYFIIHANQQRERLAALDRESAVDRSNLI